MNRFLDVESNSIVVSEFYENYTANKYNFEAVYQREKVWNIEKRKFLIDSILKNYPIPPVFLRMYIDETTGATKYDVIDGKQRLTTIVDFIEGEITLPDDFGEGEFGNSDLNGLSFVDLNKFTEYKKQFWKYKISIIYIDSTDDSVIRNVFDRLNRNGEPLTPQELRNAQYGWTNFYKTISALVNLEFWKGRLKNLDIVRMEDSEFISELLFVMLEGSIISYTKDDLDKLYKKWSEEKTDIHDIKSKFKLITDYMTSLDLDYSKYKIGGVSHLYAIWCFCYLCMQEKITVETIRPVINAFFEKLRSGNLENCFNEYKISMSANTKSQHSRKRRISSIVKYASHCGVIIENTL